MEKEIKDINPDDKWLENHEIDEERDELRLLTLLPTWYQRNGTHMRKRLDEAKIPFCDLSSLTFEDFKEMGLVNEADHLLRSFKNLPNQFLSYDDICELPTSKIYNKRIFHAAHCNLKKLCKALLLNCLKMHEQPAKDLVIGEKNYASKFLIEAYTELEKETEDLRNELNCICQTESQMNNCNLASSRKSYTFFSTLTLSIAFGVFCLWKLRKV